MKIKLYKLISPKLYNPIFFLFILIIIPIYLLGCIISIKDGMLEFKLDNHRWRRFRTEMRMLPELLYYNTFYPKFFKKYEYVIYKKHELYIMYLDTDDIARSRHLYYKYLRTKVRFNNLKKKNK